MSVRSSDGWERRTSVDVRMEVADRRIRGTAIVFNSLSYDLGGFREIIHPQAVEGARD
jgi:phage head maturation protease